MTTSTAMFRNLWNIHLHLLENAQLDAEQANVEREVVKLEREKELLEAAKELLRQEHELLKGDEDALRRVEAELKMEKLALELERTKLQEQELLLEASLEASEASSEAQEQQRDGRASPKLVCTSVEGRGPEGGDALGVRGACKAIEPGGGMTGVGGGRGVGVGGAAGGRREFSENVLGSDAETAEVAQAPLEASVWLPEGREEAAEARAMGVEERVSVGCVIGGSACLAGPGGGAGRGGNSPVASPSLQEGREEEQDGVEAEGEQESMCLRLSSCSAVAMAIDGSVLDAMHYGRNGGGIAEGGVSGEVGSQHETRVQELQWAGEQQQEQQQRRQQQQERCEEEAQSDGETRAASAAASFVHRHTVESFAGLQKHLPQLPDACCHSKLTIAGKNSPLPQLTTVSSEQGIAAAAHVGGGSSSSSSSSVWGMAVTTTIIATRSSTLRTTTVIAGNDAPRGCSTTTTQATPAAVVTSSSSTTTTTPKSSFESCPEDVLRRLAEHVARRIHCSSSSSSTTTTTTNGSSGSRSGEGFGSSGKGSAEGSGKGSEEACTEADLKLVASGRELTRQLGRVLEREGAVVALVRRAIAQHKAVLARCDRTSERYDALIAQRDVVTAQYNKVLLLKRHIIEAMREFKAERDNLFAS